MKKKEESPIMKRWYLPDVTMKRLFFLILMLAAACSGVEMKTPANNVQNNSNMNNNVAQVFRLRFVSPASGELSMSSQSRVHVVVAVETQDGLPAPGERVDLRIDGTAAGSTLSSTFAVSGENGILDFQIASGSNSAHFRVIIQHPQAVPLALDVTVSSSGTVRLRVAFSYGGAVSPDELGWLELGIAFETSCETIVPYGIDLDRVRRLDSWDEEVELTELPVDFQFSIVARGFSVSGEPLLHGCLTPEASMLIPNATVNVVMPLSDYSKTLSDPVTEEVNASAGPASAAAALGFSGWSQAGRCQLGLAQMFLDCLLAVMENGDVATCTPGEPTAETASLRSRRGVLDAADCRQNNNPESGAGLESRIHELLGWQGYQASLSALHAYLAGVRPAAVTLELQIAPDASSLMLEVKRIRFEEGDWRVLPSTALARYRLQCPAHPDRCTVNPFSLTLSWYELLVREMSDMFFTGAGMTPDGPVFGLQLREEAVQTAYPEPLSDFFARELQVQIPEALWQQAFGALGAKLGSPAAAAGASVAEDCLVSGSLFLPDADSDQHLDGVGVSLSFDLCFGGCPVLR